MYRLYYNPGAASLAVHWMLIEIGAPFELALLDFEAKAHKAPDYLELNPGGLVPTLIVDGAPVTECAALLMLLAERHAAAGFDVPPGHPDRAAYLRAMLYLANTLMPAFRAWFYPDEPAGAANADAVRAAARARIEAVFDRLDQDLAGPYLLGERVTAADFLATMLIRWSRNMPRPAAEWPRLAAYLGRMRARPALIEVHAREGLTDWIGG
ncbi:MAG: Glutathione S-transferase domain [Caulobacter sp.]|nr:Glutathione S-transferase domain [Caulobacter sp.]